MRPGEMRPRLPASIIEQLQAEARRLERSVPWVVRRCVEIALPRIRMLGARATTAAHGQPSNGDMGSGVAVVDGGVRD